MLQHFSSGGLTLVISSTGRGQFLGLVARSVLVEQFEGVRDLSELLQNPRGAILDREDAIRAYEILIEFRQGI